MLKKTIQRDNMYYNFPYFQNTLHKNKKLPYKEFKLFLEKTVYQKNVKNSHL